MQAKAHVIRSVVSKCSEWHQTHWNVNEDRWANGCYDLVVRIVFIHERIFGSDKTVIT